jgi:hypothetical protein
MFNILSSYLKRRKLKQKVELLRVKGEYLRAKQQIHGSKPSKYERLRSDIEDLGDLKEAVGSGDITKYLKLLENPAILSMIMKFLSTKSIKPETPISMALEKLKR